MPVSSTRQSWLLPTWSNSAFAAPGPLASFSRLARRTSILYSKRDKVLDILSENLNSATRLGQDGPRCRDDIALFPESPHRMVVAADSPNTTPTSKVRINTTGGRGASGRRLRH